jgi:hypothetical protein
MASMPLPRPFVMLLIVAALYAWSALDLVATRRMDADARVEAKAWRGADFGPEGRAERARITMNGIALGDSLEALQARVSTCGRPWAFYRWPLRLHLEHASLADVRSGSELSLIADDDRVVALEAGRHCVVSYRGREILRQGLPRSDIQALLSTGLSDGGVTSLSFPGDVQVKVSTYTGVVTLITVQRGGR